jgi:HEAT repeat protein
MQNLKSRFQSFTTLACLSVLLSGTGVFAQGPASKDQVAQLVAVLKSGAPQKEKADACRELARIGDKNAVAALATLLYDEKLAHMARYGLETIPSATADRAMREAAGTLQGRLLVGVIGSLGVRQDAGAVKLLKAKLKDPDTEVVQAAARALGSIATSGAAEALQYALDAAQGQSRLAICEGLLRCADSQAAKGSRNTAIKLYDRLRQGDYPHQVRTAALRGAVLTRGDAGLPLLLETINNPDFAVAAPAMRIAIELPGPDVTTALAGRLKWLPQDQQVLLVQALAARRDAKAAPALLDCAEHGAKSPRIAAIRALTEIGDPAAVPALVNLSADTDADVAQAGLEALAGMPGKEADNAVIGMFSRGTTKRRITAMDLLVRRGLTSATRELFVAANDLDPAIRVAAVKTLGQLGDAAEIPAMLRVLDRAKSPEDLEATEQALSSLCAKAPNVQDCGSQLTEAFGQAPPAQKRALLRVLTTVGGPQALKAVRATVNSPDADLREAGVRALASWNSPDVAPDLLAIVRRGGSSSDTMLCLRAYLRFAAQPDLPVEKRLAMCQEAAGLVQKDDERKLLLGALGGVAAPGALDLIDSYLEQPALQEEASAAAVAVGEKLVKVQGASVAAPRLVATLEKVSRVTANADLAKRARALVQQMQAKPK